MCFGHPGRNAEEVLRHEWLFNFEIASRKKGSTLPMETLYN
jgi:hypothetical protein